jgi:hypothetical protein
VAVAHKTQTQELETLVLVELAAVELAGIQVLLELVQQTLVVVVVVDLTHPIKLVQMAVLELLFFDTLLL